MGGEGADKYSDSWALGEESPSRRPYEPLFPTFHKATARVVSMAGQRNIASLLTPGIAGSDTVTHYDICDCPGVIGLVALTIDDTPCRQTAPSCMLKEVQELLWEFDANATFMVTAEFVSGHEEDMVELLLDEHEFGNHAMYEAPCNLLEEEEFDKQLMEAEEIVEDLRRRARERMEPVQQPKPEPKAETTTCCCGLFSFAKKARAASSSQVKKRVSFTDLEAAEAATSSNSSSSSSVGQSRSIGAPAQESLELGPNSPLEALHRRLEELGEPTHGTQEECWERIFRAEVQVEEREEEDVEEVEELPDQDLIHADRDLIRADQDLLDGTADWDSDEDDEDTEQVHWFRAPGGIMSESMSRVVKRRGFTHVLGDCYANDPFVTDPEFIAGTMLENAMHGSILVIHMPERGFREYNLPALRLVLEGLRRRGLRAVTLSTLHRASRKVVYAKRLSDSWGLAPLYESEDLEEMGRPTNSEEDIDAASRIKAHGHRTKNAPTFLPDSPTKSPRPAEHLYRSSNIVKGTITGTVAIGSGAIDGVTGLITKPIEGAYDNGAVGFAAGIGEGLACVLSKPVDGVLEGTSQIVGGAAGTVRSVFVRRQSQAASKEILGLQ